MDLDTWVRALVADCSRKELRFKKLNAMYAMGLTPALAESPDAPEDPRATLDMMWPYSFEEPESAPPPPDIYLPQTCGQLANWLCGMMLESFEVEIAKRMKSSPGSVMSDYELVKFRLQSRSEKCHYLLRVDSRPLGHSYVLYLPPGKLNSDYIYYLYQNNCNEAMPLLTLNEWLASERSRKRGDPCEHIDGLRDINSFIGLSQREWIFHTFTLLDMSGVRTFSGGKYEYQEHSVKKLRTFKMGGVGHTRQGHHFTFVRIDPKTFHANLVDLYKLSGVGSEATRFDLSDVIL